MYQPRLLLDKVLDSASQGIELELAGWCLVFTTQSRNTSTLLLRGQTLQTFWQLQLYKALAELQSLSCNKYILNIQDTIWQWLILTHSKCEASNYIFVKVITNEGYIAIYIL
ncbi:hypothetical protein EB796_013103 [Bugula neritina]|uniref:Uncharacterized protein n=1 Tax=Bugula neritina TaxID=10212 RepID=A0A7J7JSG7_BUGNE|nr:hypothetical protein EB796_013103 [Bugula neritina]